MEAVANLNWRSITTRPRVEQTRSKSAIRTTIDQQLLHESRAMVKHASASGLRLPPSCVATIDAFSGHAKRHDQSTAGSTNNTSPATPGIEDLVRAHTELSNLVAPATPRSITVLEEQKPNTPFWRLMGPVRLIRQLMVFALVLPLAFILLLTLTNVGSTEQSLQTILEKGGWLPLWNSLYFLSAAGLGAAFAGLFRANRFIARGGYDPTYESSYWIMIVLGLIAGCVLAQLLPENFNGLGELTEPLLALLGGFSAPAVHRVLNRLVETVETLVRGDATERVAALEEVASARANDALIQTRMELAKKVLRLQAELAKDGLPEAVQGKVGSLLENILPGDLPYTRSAS
jgi:hypothetical protein